MATFIRCDFCGKELASDGCPPRYKVAIQCGNPALAPVARDACTTCRGRLVRGELPRVDMDVILRSCSVCGAPLADPYATREGEPAADTDD